MIWVIVKVSCLQSNEFMVRSQTFLRPTASQEQVTPVVGTGIICSGPHRLLLQMQRQELSPRLTWVGCWRRLGAASALSVLCTHLSRAATICRGGRR